MNSGLNYFSPKIYYVLVEPDCSRFFPFVKPTAFIISCLFTHRLLLPYIPLSQPFIYLCILGIFVVSCGLRYFRHLNYFNWDYWTGIPISHKTYFYLDFVSKSLYFFFGCIFSIYYKFKFPFCQIFHLRQTSICRLLYSIIGLLLVLCSKDSKLPFR